ncbi:reverse transcriptase domain-containing protein [Tanacetum coccineum]
MRTRSQARKRRQQQVRQTSVESPNLEKPNPPIVTMDDNRTMAELLQAPTEGYEDAIEDAIVVPEITANNFEIKHGLLNLVQNKQFFGHDKEDPHAHIRYFKTEITFYDEVHKNHCRRCPYLASIQAWDRFNDFFGEMPASWVFKNLHQIVTFYNALIQMSRFIELAARWDDTVYLEELLSVINSDPNLPPSPVCEINVPEKVKSSCEDPPDLELKDLPSHLEYAFLEGDDKLPVIIAKNLKDEDKTALIKVLKSHKRAIAWKISDIKGINPQFCTHKILMGGGKLAYPQVQHQRRVNPKIHEVIKQEVIKLLDAGLIYPISDSPWVSPVHCVPKKGGITVVKNEDNELIPTRLVTGWRVCIDYRKLNDATRKDHFPLPFMDQMLERLAGNEYYCFLDGFSGYFQIPIDPLDQEKTTFTCPYGTFAYRRMPFGLCNAPGTFQRCMVAIFHDMIEKTMEFHG